MASGLRRWWCCGIAACWLLACGGVVGKPTVGGESHFLRHCGDGCGEGLKCFSDICTRGCVANQDACDDLSQTAICTNHSVEPGAIAICDVGCASNRDCAALGTGLECRDGFCRDAAPVVLEPTGGSGAGASGGSEPTGGAQASGGAQSSGGTPSSGGSESGGTSGQTWQPPIMCGLPFDAGSCRGAVPVFAAVNGQCVAKIYGGCEGNANRFFTLEECLSVCEGRPTSQPCPPDRGPRKICLECGPAGGCAKYDSFCAQVCDDTHPCASQTLQCYQGTCQAFGCE